MSGCDCYGSVREVAPAAADEIAARLELFSLSAGARFVFEPRRAGETPWPETANDGDGTLGGLVRGDGRDGGLRAAAHRRNERRFAALRAAGRGGSGMGYCRADPGRHCSDPTLSAGNLGARRGKSPGGCYRWMAQSGGQGDRRLSARRRIFAAHFSARWMPHAACKITQEFSRRAIFPRRTRTLPPRAIAP